MKITGLGKGAMVVWTILGVVLPAATVRGEDGNDNTPLQTYSRAGKGELYGLFQISSGSDDAADDSGVTLEFDSSVSGGFGVGVNFTDNINLNLDLIAGVVDFEGAANGFFAEGDAAMLSMFLNLDYNVLPSRLTPVVTAGVGITHFSGDVADTVDISETDFSYAVGGGARWDITDSLFMKFLYRSVWTELDGFSDAHRFDTFNIYFGLMF